VNLKTAETGIAKFSYYILQSKNMFKRLAGNYAETVKKSCCHANLNYQPDDLITCSANQTKRFLAQLENCLEKKLHFTLYQTAG